GGGGQHHDAGGSVGEAPAFHRRAVYIRLLYGAYGRIIPLIKSFGLYQCISGRLKVRFHALFSTDLTRMHPNGTFGYSVMNDVQLSAAQPIVQIGLNVASRGEAGSMAREPKIDPVNRF